MMISGHSLTRLAAALLVALPVLLHADDTEIYFAGGGGEVGDSNILFILDASGSMALAPNGARLSNGAANPESRYSIMRNALQRVLSNVQNVNVGFLDYGGDTDIQPEAEKARANGIRYPVSPVSSVVAGEILNEIDQIRVGGYTPIVQSIYESTLYFQGLGVDYGMSRDPVRFANPLATRSEAEAFSRRFTEGCSLNSGACTTRESIAEAIEQSVFATSGGVLEFLPSTFSTNLRCTDSYGGSCLSTDEAGTCTNYQQNSTVTGRWCTYDYQLRSRQQYRSPIVSECQQNYLVLLSDGIPETGCNRTNGNDWPGCLSWDSDNSTPIADKVASLPGFSGGCRRLSDTLADGECGAELVDYLASVDQSPTLGGAQTVNTFVVGFAVDDEGRDYLETLARPPAGNQGFYLANDENALAQALTNITLSIVNRGSSFNPPTISLDSTTGLENSKTVYLPLFEPSRSARWTGNLKRYALDNSGDTPVLVDAAGNAILDGNDQVVDTARSYWLDADAPADGGDVGSGGAAALLGTDRNLFVNMTDNTLTPLDEDIIRTNWFQPPTLETELTDAEKLRLLNYIRGIDEVSGASRAAMGDILHSRPVVVNYGLADLGEDATQEQLENATLNRSVVFTGSNEGYLHAVRASDGEELFAFMPRALLPNVKALYDNHAAEGDLNTTQHPYGLDGPITAWINDVNDDGVIEAGEFTDLNGDNNEQYYEREFVWLFVGMRRGGNQYYALDVTDPQAPQLKWVIHGGEGQFERLGQSWSKPVMTMVDLDGDNNPEPGLVFAGGYDPLQDDKNTRSADTVGNAVYIVNPDSGERLWWSSHAGADLNIADMTSSMPATVRVIDLDGNSIADRLYMADLGGRIFRIDLPDPDNSRINQSALLDDDQLQARGYLFADLSTSGTVVDNRRFYYEPDVSIINVGGNNIAAVAIGSGFRAHPLLRAAETSQDRLYVLRDAHLFDVPAEIPDALDHGDLTNVTTTLAEDRSNDADRVAASGNVRANDGGWYLDLDRTQGEKALARAVTFNNMVFFTTFIPETSAANSACSFASHTGVVYALNVKNADPVVHFTELDSEGELTLLDRKTEMSTADILSEVYFNVSTDDSGAPVVDAFIGARFDRQLSRQTLAALRRLYWYEQRDN